MKAFCALGFAAGCAALVSVLMLRADPARPSAAPNPAARAVAAGEGAVPDPETAGLLRSIERGVQRLEARR